MSRKTVGIAFVTVVLFAFPVILFAEDVSLDTLTVWVKELAFEQDRQSERMDALEERVERISAALTSTPIASPTGPPPPDPPPPDQGTPPTPVETPTRPPVPSLRAYTPSNTLGSIQLDWDAVFPADSSSPEVGYQLQVRSRGQQWRTINRARPYISSFLHTGLENGLTYYYRVRAVPHLQKPGRWSSTVSAITLRPVDILPPTPPPTPNTPPTPTPDPPPTPTPDPPPTPTPDPPPTPTPDLPPTPST